MKIKKPQFWDYKKPNIFAYLLLPISIFLQFLNLIKRIIKTKKKINNIKTICVGNIYIGGTGKTSLCLKIHEILKEKNLNPCFIKKSYDNQIDEQKILEKRGKLFRSNKRSIALQKAIDENYQIAIFDDGLQDVSINYDLNFLCFNNLNWVGNRCTIPSGPLRENFSNIKKYDNIFLNGNSENLEPIKEEIFKINPSANIYVGKYIPQKINNFDKKQNYLVFSGIGNHKTFVSMLKIYNFNIVKDIEFPDHYNYSQKDIDEIIATSKNINCKILTTEKDFMRSKDYISDEIEYISSKLEISNEEKLLKTLSKIYEKI